MKSEYSNVSLCRCCCCFCPLCKFKLTKYHRFLRCRQTLPDDVVHDASPFESKKMEKKYKMKIVWVIFRAWDCYTDDMWFSIVSVKQMAFIYRKTLKIGWYYIIFIKKKPHKKKDSPIRNAKDDYRILVSVHNFLLNVNHSYYLHRFFSINLSSKKDKKKHNVEKKKIRCAAVKNDTRDDKLNPNRWRKKICYSICFSYKAFFCLIEKNRAEYLLRVETKRRKRERKKKPCKR